MFIGWIPYIYIYKPILNYITKPSLLIRTVNHQRPNLRIPEIHLDTNGNAHSIRSVLCIIISSLTPIVIEMLLYVLLAS
jgi:hypothetical protein